MRYYGRTGTFCSDPRQSQHHSKLDSNTASKIAGFLSSFSQQLVMGFTMIPNIKTIATSLLVGLLSAPPALSLSELARSSVTYTNPSKLGYVSLSSNQTQNSPSIYTPTRTADQCSPQTYVTYSSTQRVENRFPQTAADFRQSIPTGLNAAEAIPNQIRATTHAQKSAKRLATSSTTPDSSNNRSGTLDPIFVRVSRVSDSFVKEIIADASELPSKLRSALAKAGYHIAISPSLADAVPAARDTQVRGYKAFVTWNQLFGMFNRRSKSLIMAEKAEASDGKVTTLEEKNIRAGILRHEFGHAVDQYLQYPSHSLPFAQAYAQGVARLNSDERQTLNYYLQPGKAGKEEVFAEIFAILHKDACNPESDRLLRAKFPELLAIMNTIISKYKS